MLHTISDIPYTDYDPSGDFSQWEKGLKLLIDIYAQDDEISENRKIMILLSFLPSNLRQEAVITCVKPITYQSLVTVLEETYVSTTSLEEFFSCTQQKQETALEYIKKMEQMGLQLKLKESDIVKRVKNGIDISIRQYIVASSFASVKELRSVVIDCMDYNSTNNVKASMRGQGRHNGHKDDKPEIYKDKKVCTWCHKGHFHRWFDCRDAHLAKENTPPPKSINFITNARKELDVSKYQELELDSVVCNCIVDTGADVSVCNKHTVQNLELSLIPSNCEIIGGGEPIQALGEAIIQVKIMDKVFDHNFIVLDSDYPPNPIIGRDILSGVLNCKIVWSCDSSEAILNNDEIEIEFNSIKENYNHIDGEAAFIKPVAIKLKDNVNLEELKQKPFVTNDPTIMNDLMADLVNRKIVFRGLSRFATPCFPRPKPNGTYRCVADYRRLNQNTVPVGHSLPLLKDILQLFKGFTIFTKADILDGFFNLGVDWETSLLTAVVTNDDQFLMGRLGQGLKQSTGIFQHEMTTAYQTIERKAIFVDDVVLFDNNIQDHLNQFDQFVKISTDLNININWNKTEIAKDSIVFCGFKVDKDGYSCKPGYIIQLKGVMTPRTKRDCAKNIGMLG